MKRLVKKIFPIFLALCIVNLCVFSVCASTPGKTDAASDNDAATIKFLKNYGLSDDDIATILEYEKSHIRTQPHNMNTRISLPSNPKEGDVVYETIFISNGTINGMGGTTTAIILELIGLTGLSAIALGGFVNLFWTYAQITLSMKA